MPADETNETSADDAGAPPEDPQGVFGNLPKTRPGARSPRRDDAAAPKPRSAGAGSQAGRAREPERAREPATSDVPDSAAARASQPGRGEPADQADPRQGGGIEDVAWAGVAAAAEAATIGVRLATRALEAMRDTVDRR